MKTIMLIICWLVVSYFYVFCVAAIAVELRKEWRIDK